MDIAKMTKLVRGLSIAAIVLAALNLALSAVIGAAMTFGNDTILQTWVEEYGEGSIGLYAEGMGEAAAALVMGLVGCLVALAMAIAVLLICKDPAKRKPQLVLSVVGAAAAYLSGVILLLVVFVIIVVVTGVQTVKAPDPPKVV